ncbi:MAG TPA: type IV pilin protein [Burkholderiales bacterium]|nr:type IV pilin protein [Burkholderiales bacterium]
MPRQQGFTIVELMVVVAIAAIIAAFAIPAYNEYTTRAKLQEATSQLSEWRTRMENYYADNRRYSSAAGAGQTDCGAAAPLAGNARYFTYTCVSAGGTAAGSQTYLLTATGGTAVAGFVFTLDHANAKQTTGVGSGWTAPSPNNCWVQKKGGQC